MGDFVDLSHLTESPDAPPVISRRGSNRAGAELLEGRVRQRGNRRVFTIGSASFTLNGERLGVRWYDTWGGWQTRELARGDVEGVDFEPDDRSAEGRQTWRVVVRLRGGDAIMPVRRCNREACEAKVAKLAQVFALGSTAAAPVRSMPTEELPGSAYVSMAAAGAGMRPIVEGGGTLVGAGAEGAALMRFGEQWPALLVGADRKAFWARAVGLPPGWDESREVARAWVASDVFRVYEIPGDEVEERTWGRRVMPAWSGVWTEMRDGTRVRVARRLPHAEAAAVVAALTGALALPSQGERSRAYLAERRSESVGGWGGVSGDGAATAGAGARSPVGRRGAIVLPYAREPVDAIRVIRGDGVLRVSVPAVSFWRGWIRRVVGLIPVALFLGWVAFIVCPARTNHLQTVGIAVPAVTLIWLGLAAVGVRGRRTELVVADGILTAETLWPGSSGRKEKWAVEDFLDVREGFGDVNVIVLHPDWKRQRRRLGFLLLRWDNAAARRRVVEILRAAVGLAADPAEVGAAARSAGGGTA